MSQLTVLIPCKDEIRNIRDCLDSARQVADEILVADSGSTDGTLEYLRSQPDVRVIERELITCGDFKNWAIPQAEHPWIFVLDCDERITSRLADEVREIVDRDGELDGYWTSRDNHFMGHRVRHSGWGNDSVMRLFRRDVGRYDGPSDHGEVELPGGRAGHLDGRLTHFTFSSYDQYFRKFQRYTTLQAQQWFDEGRRPSFLRLLMNPPLRFLRSYVLQRGFLDGLVGLQIAIFTGFYSFMKQARLWELHARGEDPAEHNDGVGTTAATVKFPRSTAGRESVA